MERVPARSGWPHEAHKFTPWLAENVDLLGDALGLSLELKAREHQVGRMAEQLERLVASDDLQWKLQFRKGYLALLRPGGYRVAIIDVYWKSAPRFAVRLPDTPETASTWNSLSRA